MSNSEDFFANSMHANSCVRRDRGGRKEGEMEGGRDGGRERRREGRREGRKE